MHYLQKALELFFIYIIVRGIIAPFIANGFKMFVLNPLLRLFANHYIKTERELAIWLHYRNKALNKGHHHKHLGDCEDGKCRLI